MRNDAVLGRALPLDRGLGPEPPVITGPRYCGGGEFILVSDSIIDSQQSRYHLMQHLYPHTQAKYGYPDLEVTYLNRNEIEATQYMHFTDLPVRLGMLGRYQR